MHKTALRISHKNSNIHYNESVYFRQYPALTNHFCTNARAINSKFPFCLSKHIDVLFTGSMIECIGTVHVFAVAMNFAHMLVATSRSRAQSRLNHSFHIVQIVSLRSIPLFTDDLPARFKCELLLCCTGHHHFHKTKRESLWCPARSLAVSSARAIGRR